MYVKHMKFVDIFIMCAIDIYTILILDSGMGLVEGRHMGRDNGYNTM